MPKNNYMPPPSFGRTGSYNQSQPNKENMHTTANFKSFHHYADTNTRPPRPNDIRGQGFTPHKAGGPKIVEPPTPRTTPNRVRSTSPVDTGPPGRAVEPTEHHVRVVIYCIHFTAYVVLIRLPSWNHFLLLVRLYNYRVISPECSPLLLRAWNTGASTRCRYQCSLRSLVCQTYMCW